MRENDIPRKIMIREKKQIKKGDTHQERKKQEMTVSIPKQTLFVTVGNGKFDPLVKELDRLKSEGKINYDVIIQLGHGEYKPQHCQWFTFDSHLGKYYEKADLIIGHGGPGTVFEILRLKKRLIAIPNRDRTDPQHQVEYLEAMAKETASLLYCDAVEKIGDFLAQAEKHVFTEYQPPPCSIHLKLHEVLQTV